MKKTLALVLVLIMVAFVAVSCAPAAPAPSEAPAATDEATDAPEEGTEAPDEAAEVIDIAVIIKATDSDFWQYVLVGAQNYAFENADAVKVTTYGPPSEADIDEQVQILDDVVTKAPDGIVIASTSSDAANAGIDSAMAAGIPVVTIDNKVTTENYVTLLATDNLAAGAAAAERFVAECETRGVELKGTVGLISSMAGVQVLADREDGFIQKMAEIAPDLTVLPKVYIDSDQVKALAAAENLYTANKDLVGIFASNNCTGNGLATFIAENKLGEKLIGLVFDSDKLEIDAIKNGDVVATIVQDPYGMGYKGCTIIHEIASGAKTAADYEKYIDTGVSVVDGSNVESEEMAGVLDPFSLKMYE